MKRVALFVLIMGALSDIPATREPSGTSWQPDSSPHEAVHSSTAHPIDELARLGRSSRETHALRRRRRRDQNQKSATPTANPAETRPLPRVTIEVDTLTPGEWDRVVGDFDDATWEQTACWMEGRWGQRTSHLLVRRDGAPAAGARVVVFRVPGLRSGLAHMKFGPFYRRSGEPLDADLYPRTLTALVDEFCVRRGHCLSIVPRPTPGRYEEETAALTALGFKVRRPRLDPNRYLVDPLLAPPERLASLEQKWRYNLRLGSRNGLRCGIANSDEGRATFMALYARMMARKGIPALDPVELLPQLSTRLTDRMKPQIVLAHRGDAPVAGAVVALCGDTAFYMFGASDDAALPLKAGYALQWWIVEWLATAGVRWYDLGGEASTQGLRQFKKGLVGRRGTTLATLGEFERWTSPTAGVAGTAVHRLRNLRRALRRLF